MTKCNADDNIYPSTTRAPREKKIIKKKVYLQFFLLLCDTYLTFWAKTAILKTVEKESMKNEKFISFFGSATTPW
mgnify:CR=1 FL=1